MAKSLKQSIVIIVIVAVSSFSAGRLTAPSAPVKSSPQTIEVEKEVIKSIVKEKVIFDPKSKEYYEKAFTLFLAAIGVKLSHSQEYLAQELLENPKEFSKKDISADSYKEPSPLEPIIPTQNLRKSHPAQDVENPQKTWQASRLIKDIKALRRFNGEYKGELKILEGNQKGEFHQVYLGLDYLRNGNEISGEFRAELARDGEVYSNSKGSGGNNQLRLSGEDLIIEVSPSSYFYFKNKKLNKGTYYSRGKFQGTVRLEKMR